MWIVMCSKEEEHIFVCVYIYGLSSIRVKCCILVHIDLYSTYTVFVRYIYTDTHVYIYIHIYLHYRYVLYLYVLSSSIVYLVVTCTSHIYST